MRFCNRRFFFLCLSLHVVIVNSKVPTVEYAVERGNVMRRFPFFWVDWGAARRYGLALPLALKGSSRSAFAPRHNLSVALNKLSAPLIGSVLFSVSFVGISLPDVAFISFCRWRICMSFLTMYSPEAIRVFRRKSNSVGKLSSLLRGGL